MKETVSYTELFVVAKLQGHSVLIEKPMKTETLGTIRLYQ